jgi:hypothetical protein
METQTYEPPSVAVKMERIADAEQWAAARDDLMLVSIALTPLLAVYPQAKEDLEAAIDRATLNITSKLGYAFSGQEVRS